MKKKTKHTTTTISMISKTAMVMQMLVMLVFLLTLPPPMVVVAKWVEPYDGSAWLCFQLKLSNKLPYHSAHYARMWFAHLGVVDRRYQPTDGPKYGPDEPEQPSSSNIHQVAKAWNKALLEKLGCELPLEPTPLDDGGGQSKMQSIVDRVVTEADDTFLSTGVNKGIGTTAGNTWYAWPKQYLAKVSAAQDKLMVCDEVKEYIKKEKIKQNQVHPDPGYPEYDLWDVNRRLQTIMYRNTKSRKRRQAVAGQLGDNQLENILLMQAFLCPMKADYHLSVGYLKQRVNQFRKYTQSEMVTKWRKETIQANLLAVLERSEYFTGASEDERECLFMHLLAHVLGYSPNAVNSDLSMPALGMPTTGFGGLGGLVEVARELLFFSTFPLVRKPNKGFEVANFDVIIDQFVRSELAYLRLNMTETYGRKRELKLASPQMNNEFLKVASFYPISEMYPTNTVPPEFDYSYEYRSLHRWTEVMLTIAPVMVAIDRDVDLDQYRAALEKKHKGDEGEGATDDQDQNNPYQAMYPYDANTIYVCQALFPSLSSSIHTHTNPPEDPVTEAPDGGGNGDGEEGDESSCCLRVLCASYVEQFKENPKRTVVGTISTLGLLGLVGAGAYRWIRNENKSIFDELFPTAPSPTDINSSDPNGNKADAASGGLLFYGLVCGFIFVLILLVLGVGYFIIVPYYKKGRFTWFSINGGGGEGKKHGTTNKDGQNKESSKNTKKKDNKYQGGGTTTTSSTSSASTLILKTKSNTILDANNKPTTSRKAKTFKGNQQRSLKPSTGTGTVKEQQQRQWPWQTATSGLKGAAKEKTTKPQAAGNNKASKSKTTAAATAAAGPASPKEVTKKVVKEVSKPRLGLVDGNIGGRFGGAKPQSKEMKPKNKEQGSVMSLLLEPFPTGGGGHGQGSTDAAATAAAATTTIPTQDKTITQTHKPKYAF